MSTTKTQHAETTMKKKYTHSSKAEWESFKGDLRDLTKLHKDKLHTVVTGAELHSLVVRRITKEAKAEAADDGIASGAATTAYIESRLQEYLEECLSTAFSMLTMNIDHARLKDTLRKKHDDDVYAAVEYIDEHWAVTGNTTRITIEADRRKEHIEAGVLNPNYAGVKEFADTLTERNDELTGSEHHFGDALLVTTVLDAVAYHHSGMVRTFRAANRAQLDDYEKTYKLILVEIEENDRVEAKSAARTSREALKAQVVEVAAREAKLSKREAEMEARLASVERNAHRAGTEHRPPAPECDTCGAPHAGICYGKELVEKRMSLEQVAAKLNNPPRFVKDAKDWNQAAKLQLAERFQKRCIDFQQAKGSKPKPAVAPGQPPPRRPLAAPASVVRSPADLRSAKSDIIGDPSLVRLDPTGDYARSLGRNVTIDVGESTVSADGDEHSDNSLHHTRVVTARKASTLGDALASTGLACDGEIVRRSLKQDSQCEQHMLRDRAFFPWGVNPSEHVKVRVADGRLVNTGGEGTAVYIEESTGEIIIMHNTLLVPGLDASLASVKQSWAQSRTKVLFDPDRVIIFHDEAGEESARIPLDSNYALSIRSPTTEEVCIAGGYASAAATLGLPEAQMESPLNTLVTRGKGAGGPASKLPAKETGDLWAARLNLAPGRLRSLPDITADAPSCLAGLKPGMIYDASRLSANAPRIHPAPVDRPRTDHAGQLTCTDLLGPLPPSKWGGNRYATNFIDVHTGEYDPQFLRTKAQFPDRLQSYFVENDGRDGCCFTGGTFYTDNEIVLNSSRVYDTCSRFGVTINNSCEYEPWQNGIPERGWRSLTDGMRTMHERGGAGDDYWPFSMAQTARISKRTGHAWGGDDHRTPFEVRRGYPPTLGDMRPMFCLAFVRCPPALRTGKLAPQADRCIHLGNARTKPGYVFEALEGPRKGRLIYSSQAVFRETTFPLLDAQDVPEMPPRDDELEMLEDFGEDASEEETTPTVPAVPGGGGQADDTHDAPPQQGHEPRRSGRRTENNMFALDRGAAARLPQTIFHAHSAECVTRAVYMTCIDAMPSETPEPPPRKACPRDFDDIKNLGTAEQHRWYGAHYHENDRLFQMPGGRGLTAVPREAGDTVLPLRTIYTVKTSGDAKARTVLGGHRMVQGRDYFEGTFSPTVKYVTLRAFLATAAERGDIVTRGDDTQAYLQAERPDGKNGKPNRAQMPKGYERFIDGVEHIVEVGNLYGGPPAGRNWYKTKVKWLTEYGFKQDEWDPCLFLLRREDGATLRIVLYVDDFLAAHTKESNIRDEFAAAYGARFLWTDYGTDLGEFLSINIEQPGDGTITIDSERYIEDLAAAFFPGGVHASYELPSTSELLKLVEAAACAKVVPEPAMLRRFQSLAMTELFVATTTRPEISWAVGMLARVLAYPTPELMLAAERVAIYLYKTRSLKIKYEPTAGTRVRGEWAPCSGPVTDGLADASFEQARSTSGYVFLFAKASIAWCTKKQSSIALSSFEAEIMAGSLSACEAIFLRGILKTLGFPQDAPTLLRMDNSGAIDVANDPVNHAKSKHILRRELHIRELIESGVVMVKYVKSAENTADVFTKHLDRVAFQKHRATLYNNSA